MSCDTLNSAAIHLNVSVASLPEGFCPTTMQELANAIGARLLISPSTEFVGIAIGSTAPASNVGPWLKDCLEWFVFDDATATYIPIAKGGFDSQEYHETSGTFVVPDSIFKLRITAFGAGAGGSGTITGSNSGSGGGGGAYGMSIIDVTPGQVIAYTVGTGGAGGAAGAGAAGADGGATVIDGRTAAGGLGASTALIGGLGGSATGFDINLSGQAGQGIQGSAAYANGGDAGGWGGKGGVVMNAAVTAGRNGLSPGGGASGGSIGGTPASGSGANGAVLIEY